MLRPERAIEDLWRPIPAYPSPARAWYLAAVLLLVIALSYLDRMVVSILVVPIQADLQLTDSQIGFLLGPAFVFLYALFGLPMGYLVDRSNRRNVLAAGLLIWTIGTLVCGAAHSFNVLLFGRSLVGLGEACVVPCTYSLIADAFPPHKRGRAVGVVSTGLSVGAGTALFGGGYLLELSEKFDHIEWPVLGLLTPWQLVFFCCGLPGFAVLILMVLTIREPDRHEQRNPATNDEQQRMGDLLSLTFGDFMRRNAGAIMIIFGGYMLFTLIQYAMTSWTPTMLTRRLGIHPASTGYILGTAIILTSPLGALCGGFVGDAMSKRWQDGRLRLAMCVSPFFIPGVLLTVFGSTVFVVMIGACLTGFTGTLIGTSAFATVQEMSPGRVRGRILAVYALAHGLIGVMLGAPSVAFVTDNVFADPGKIHLSLLIVGSGGAALATALFAFGLRGFVQMRREAGTGFA